MKKQPFWLAEWLMSLAIFMLVTATSIDLWKGDKCHFGQGFKCGSAARETSAGLMIIWGLTRVEIKKNESRWSGSGDPS